MTKVSSFPDERSYRRNRHQLITISHLSLFLQFLGQACDMWSIGVITYVLLAGYPPFGADNQAELFRQIRTGDVKFHEKEWAHVNTDVKALIKGLLKVDPNQRLTAEQALQNNWFSEDDDLLSSNELSSSLREIKEIRKKHRGLSGAIRWLTMSLQSDPVKVEKLAPIADKDDMEISQRELV